jgi:hypothetical protein
MPAKVCEYCRSVVSRDGLELTSLGKIAVLPEDVSPLQIGVHGQWEGSAYAIVGRLRWRWAAGAWTEWLAVTQEGVKLWLGDAMGRFMVLSETEGEAAAAAVAELGPNPRPGARAALLGVDYELLDVKPARLVGAQGELPYQPGQGVELMNFDLADATGRCASIQILEAQASAYVGRYAGLEALAPRGLRPVPGWPAPAFADA